MSPLEPKIIAEEKDYWVVDKPSGIAAHPDSKHQGNTVVDFLLQKDSKLAKIGDDPSRPGIVHRLDLGVSGLMVVARTSKFFKLLKAQFGHRSVEKRYWALVHGKNIAEEGEIHFPIARSRGDRTRMAALPDVEINTSNLGKIDHTLAQEDIHSRDALTLFTVSRRWVNYTLLDIEIKTGRTHQIRVHMQAFGHPVVGDMKYRLRKQEVDTDLGRLFLHSYRLGFQDAKGKPVIFESPLPEKLEEYLKGLRGELKIKN
ncbi:MAG: 23S rRNA pseudouridine synthase [Parcubacteria group bacterium Gr01-1014_18]|nr:MAG: 23S rRNA pseudouridine synthase [Parcubacteria group bacterium Greene0416_36]TSC80104.1 MAG: 23S rRNA pseudouridine synthase [Parcubacteria group bacterium Gr01-1014_18]TSC98606.1 MAG: 23S rRNA pseudouridine synthase [Parcubacteria group bacterium Greene1014_20]TSD06433.1 MAG: 23S rRNA pseudouridine synthase [Parcubacteria group bacterium Greene0714_2]